MSMKVMDGARTIDGANSGTDIPYQTLTVGMTAQANSTGVDMSNHFELLATFLAPAVAAGCTLTCLVQESDEAAANFTNITGAAATIAAGSANLAEWISVDWKHPDRKKYARLSMLATGANTATVAALSLRVNEGGGDVDADDNMTEVTN